MRIKYAIKFSFFYVVVLCTTTGETEQMLACACRYINPRELPINEEARSKAHIASTVVRWY